MNCENLYPVNNCNHKVKKETIVTLRFTLTMIPYWTVKFKSSNISFPTAIWDPVTFPPIFSAIQYNTVFLYFWSITAVLFKCDIHPHSSPLSLSLFPTGVWLTADTVFKLLKKTNKEWDWLAAKILMIYPSKHHEIAQHCSTTDDCLMESIKFWLKRCPYASYRWIAYFLNIQEMTAISQEMHHLLEPIQGKMSGRYY